MKFIILGFEVLVGLGFLVFVYSQLIHPLFRSTPVFPMFRPRRKIEAEIEQVNEQLEDKKLNSELIERQRQLGKKK